MKLYVYLLLVSTFNYGQVTSCPVECVWNPWQTWQCDLCCKSNAGTNVAYRQRSVCCNTNSDVSACIKNCGYTQNDAQELDSCLRHCPMCAPPTTIKFTMPAWLAMYGFGVTHASTSTAQSRTRMATTKSSTTSTLTTPTTTIRTTKPTTATQTSTTKPSTAAQTSATKPTHRTTVTATTSSTAKPTPTAKTSSTYTTTIGPRTTTHSPTTLAIKPGTTTKTTVVPNTSSIKTTSEKTVPTSQRTRTSSVAQGPGYPVLHIVETINGTATHDLMTFSQREIDDRACLKRCKDRDDTYDCLVECIVIPCTKLLTIGGPCLFLLGVLVGTTAVCFIKRMVERKREQDNQTSVHPIESTMDF